MSEARDLVGALGGRWHGRGGLCFCPAHDNRRTPALSVAEGEDGRLLLHCFAGCGFGEVWAALRQRGLVADGGSHGRLAPTGWGKDAAPIGCAGRSRTTGDGNSAAARAIWDAASPAQGTLAERYLAGRGVEGTAPASLRFHAMLRHPSGGMHPAMVARIEGGDAFAIHRTFLDAKGGKRAGGAAKLMLGPAAGGAVRLASAAGPLVVAEGIETALSLPPLGVAVGELWAALSTGGMRGLRLPKCPHHLVVAVDADPPGRDAGRDLAERAHRTGWRVEWLEPPDGLDFNDVLMARGGEVRA